VEAKIFQTHSDWHWVIRSFPGEKRPRRSIFIKGRVIPLLPLCAFMAQRGECYLYLSPNSKRMDTTETLSTLPKKKNYG